MSGPYDLVVVGGGPAGVAGALTAALRGLRVALIDSEPRLGGQYFRHRAVPGEPVTGEFARFRRQMEALTTRADVLGGRQVWAVAREDDGFAVHLTDGNAVRGGKLLLATGAHDRPLPFPGWDLPGVLTAGGAQALLKGQGVVAGRRIVVAGTGPFLLPVAAGLAAAGATVIGVHEANGGLGLARHPLLALGRAGEAAGYLAALARHRVPYRTRHAVVAAHGDEELEAVTVARLDRDWNVLDTRRVACDALATGYGFTPRLDLGIQLGCATRPDADGTPVLSVDAAQRTTVPGVWAAGEPTGVGGRHLAEVEGRIAGLTIAGSSGAGSSGAGTREIPGVLARRRARLRAFAAALAEAYPVKDGWQSWLRDDTLVCRCEEVPLARIREATQLGATDARSAKLLSRAGMGWCQGRICGYPVACLTGGGHTAPRHTAPRRPVAQPITLADLAGALEPRVEESHD